MKRVDVYSDTGRQIAIAIGKQLESLRKGAQFANDTNPESFDSVLREMEAVKAAFESGFVIIERS